MSQDLEGVASGRLPDALPADPFPMLKAWFDEAIRRADQPNPSGMQLATVSADGRPRVRTVLCRGIVPDPGFIVFFTNRRSRKGQDLEATGVASAVFHWDHQGRQATVEGVAVRSPEPESDAYYNARALGSRLGSWASEQSQPIDSHETLRQRVHAVWAKYGVTEETEDADVPRPEHWGGYRIWARRVELWVDGPSRLHDRAEWTRALTPTSGGFDTGSWAFTRLQP